MFGMPTERLILLEVAAQLAAASPSSAADDRMADDLVKRARNLMRAVDKYVDMGKRAEEAKLEVAQKALDEVLEESRAPVLNKLIQKAQADRDTLYLESTAMTVSTADAYEAVNKIASDLQGERSGILNNLIQEVAIAVPGTQAVNGYYF